MPLSAHRPGHAYILEGDALDDANAFAKALNCLQGGEMACGACISCRVFDSGNHPDTHYVTGTGIKSIRVGDVREQVIVPMATAPSNYKYKIFIVDKAETLNDDAQNALLKTIEEPAPYGVFLLLTARREALLETVRSRCVTIKTNTAPPPADETDLTALRALTDGLLTTAHTADILGALALYKKLEPFKEEKESLNTLLDMLYEGYGTQLRTTRAAHTPRAIKAIARTKEFLSQNANFQLTLELMLLQIGGHV